MAGTGKKIDSKDLVFMLMERARNSGWWAKRKTLGVKNIKPQNQNKSSLRHIQSEYLKNNVICIYFIWDIISIYLLFII